ncbi:hypothetical protein HS088_TW14G00839 [Tripterygium wilfordii]|uniref:C2 domain-containing protein n=1 Tax=Tripterygium wilfordii TaxID=458696 RepID=A0A7J7CRV2_TRIWF|nr:hypothetical protein HS088_TW14G00839 [Tripterygium wilfordii]
MATFCSHHHTHLQFHRFRSSLSPTLHNPKTPSLPRRFPPLFSGKIGVVAFRGNYGERDRGSSMCCFCKTTDVEKIAVEESNERPPFDINLAVILAGFAFEAYTSPPENMGRTEVDAAGCKAVYLSESFVREIYDGQLSIKLKKGLNFPAMDPWGTSDPYVVMQLNGQVAKSKVKWGTKEPTWNQEFTFNIKLPTNEKLQVAAWDANLVTPHKRMGNAGISLECLSDGNVHDVLVELEGMGGGGKVQLEVKYKSFDEIDDEKKWWRVPFLSEFLKKNNFESALKMVVGSETVPARQFVEHAFGQLKSFNELNNWKNQLLNGYKHGEEGVGKSNDSVAVAEMLSPTERNPETLNDSSCIKERNSESHDDNVSKDNEFLPELVVQFGDPIQSDKHFWKNFSDAINKNVVQSFGLSFSDKLKWDGFDLLYRIGLQSRKIAEAGYIESGLATPEAKDVDHDKASSQNAISSIQASIPEIKKATQDLLRQTDSILGALMVLTATVPQQNQEASILGKRESEERSSSKVEDGASGTLQRGRKLTSSVDNLVLDEDKDEERKALFSTAESAMEAWAMLATALGHPSFIRSEFEKICFLDNESTDTQVAIWCDSSQRRVVVAFRGTEQARWKDLRTDLMLVPAGLNPERIGGDFKQEVQVHSGFLSAYDSVRIRIISIIKLSIGYDDRDDIVETLHRWHVYVTGHSLGGALATLLALELSSSQLMKRGAISVTMYNFGSPRVGNKRFADVYNKKVKDSWRVVNHRDIIPTVPRLMGYCHVAQPVYLAAGVLRNAFENTELLKDGYEGDVIGEATPDVIVTEFRAFVGGMKRKMSADD